ncbi:MAG: DUF4294 domain-containing protein [Dysgonamonadaceae bacterium]|jgi:hypothetical protein|nr:DUF4294 domain-containing protein [Dysgonamonadaceae bacterium]
MKFVLHILLALLFVLLSFQAKAQETDADVEQRRTIYLLPNVYPAVIIGTDTVATIWLREFTKFAPLQFRNAQEQMAYDRLVRDVKRTLPFAKRIAQIMIETYEYIETLPDDRARQRHLNQMDRHLRQEYTPQMRQLTRSQGQLLMVLIDRETNSSSFHIIEATMGRVQALAANTIARLWGNNLRTRYDPYGEHRMVERVAIMVEQGLL